jgi:hypothetical protein
MREATCPCGYTVLRIDDTGYEMPPWTTSTFTLTCTKCGGQPTSPPQEPQMREATP